MNTTQQSVKLFSEDAVTRASVSLQSGAIKHLYETATITKEAFEL
ncbi:MAG: hypothetical protein ABIZ64_06885 [Casimicrobium sp.]